MKSLLTDAVDDTVRRKWKSRIKFVCLSAILGCNFCSEKILSSMWSFNWCVTVRAIKLSWVRFPVGPLSSYLPIVYSAFHPSGVGKSSTGLAGWGYGGVNVSDGR